MTKKYLFMFFAVAISALPGCHTGMLGPDPWSAAPSLEFPVQVPSNIKSLGAFGTPNWSGTQPHNGIDLVMKPGTGQEMIIAPAPGTVTNINSHSNSFSHPPGQLILTVDVMVDMDWTYSLNYEPGTNNDALKSSQASHILVKVGQKLRTGDHVGFLLEGELGYMHMHFGLRHRNVDMCAYLESSAASKAIFDAIGNTSGTKACY